ncbi:hypothetical protein KCU69_g72, partial [Aureobasidium melanogenum]
MRKEEGDKATAWRLFHSCGGRSKQGKESNSAHSLPFFEHQYKTSMLDEKDLFASARGSAIRATPCQDGCVAKSDQRSQTAATSKRLPCSLKTYALNESPLPRPLFGSDGSHWHVNAEHGVWQAAYEEGKRSVVDGRNKSNTESRTGIEQTRSQ